MQNLVINVLMRVTAELETQKGSAKSILSVVRLSETFVIWQTMRTVVDSVQGVKGEREEDGVEAEMGGRGEKDGQG